MIKQISVSVKVETRTPLSFVQCNGTRVNFSVLISNLNQSPAMNTI